MAEVLSSFKIIKTESMEWATLHSYAADGVLEIHYGDFLYTIEMGRAVTDLCGKLSNGRKLPILQVASRYSDLDAETRNFMSTPEALRYSTAEAYVIKSLSQRLLGNFYLKFQKPSIPTRLFSDTTQARLWLIGQKR